MGKMEARDNARYDGGPRPINVACLALETRIADGIKIELTTHHEPPTARLPPPPGALPVLRHLKIPLP